MASTSSLAPPLQGGQPGFPLPRPPPALGSREGAGGDPGAEVAGREAVLAVKDQAGVEDPSGEGSGARSVDHVEKIANRGESSRGWWILGLRISWCRAATIVGIWRISRITGVNDVIGSSRPRLNEEPKRGGASGCERIHRVRVPAVKHFTMSRIRKLHPTVHLDIVLGKRAADRKAGQIAPDQQIGRFQEAAVRAKLSTP